MLQSNAFGMKFIDPKNATWAEDKLDRAKYATQLTNLANMDKPFVMTLSAPFFLMHGGMKLHGKGKLEHITFLAYISVLGNMIV